ncbi:regulator of G-protein signaling [Acrasis kona]|uniref:Regulator of G-protein signaling n=1 Tax=Acrasis kona TaxID=1008807 RepID=A0AAW2ZSI7_9EUKA
MFNKITSYDFDFDAVFDDPDLRNCLQCHLKAINEEGPYIFLTALEQYKRYIGCIPRYKAARNIMNQYISPGSQRDLNLDEQERCKILELFSKCTETNCPSTLFDDLRTHMYIEIKEEIMPDFFKSTTFISYIKEQLKKDPSYLCKIGTKRNKKVQTRKRGDSIFNGESSITDEDFEYALTNFNRSESDWKVIEKTSTCSQSVAKNLNNPSRFNDMREVMSFECSAEEAYHIMTCTHDYRERILRIQNSHFTYLDTFVRNSYAGISVHIKSQLPFPMKNRDFSAVITSRRQPDGSILLLAKNVNNDKIPKNKKYVRGVFFHLKLFKNTENGCEVTSISQIDLAGQSSPTLFNLAIKYKKRDSEIYDLIVGAVEERKLLGITGPEPEHPLSHILKHFEKTSGCINDGNVV